MYTHVSPSADVIVVGAGAGGLAAAADLSRAGYDVLVVEREAKPGGKIATAEVAGLPIDCGPTVLTMRWVFDALFDDAGRVFANDVTLVRADILATHVWPDGQRIELFDDDRGTLDAIRREFGSEDARGYAAFRAYGRRIYETVKGPFLESQRPSPLDLARASARIGLSAFGRIDAHRSMANALAEYFRSPRLRQLFGRYATYCGSSPYAAPATLNLVAHVEQEGVFLVDGGMGQVVRALFDLAQSSGARVRLGCDVCEVLVSGGRARGVVLATGERLFAPIVVVNADAAALASGALGAFARRGAKTIPRLERSLSAVTFSVVAKSGGPLARHNVFFSDDYAAEFEDLFGARRLPRAPSVYVCAQDRGAGLTDAHDDHERLFVIINAPADGDRPAEDSTEIDRCERTMLETLATCGTRLEIVDIKRMAPRAFEARFPGTGGALYGRASHGMTSALSRPAARTRISGMYLCGGSAHPGPGVPMAVLSGRLAARAVLLDRRSIGTSRAAVTPGSTQTA